MAQFDLFWNDAESFWLVDVQHDLISGLATRVVIPLLPAASAPRPIERLNPVIRIDHADHVLMTDQLSAVQRSLLGEARGNIAGQRDRIVAAVDLLVTGI